jgi:hypothetical protein
MDITLYRLLLFWNFFLFSWSLGATKLQLRCHIQSGHHVLPIHHLIDDILINDEHVEML